MVIRAKVIGLKWWEMVEDLEGVTAMEARAMVVLDMVMVARAMLLQVSTDRELAIRDCTDRRATGQGSTGKVG